MVNAGFKAADDGKKEPSMIHRESRSALVRPMDRTDRLPRSGSVGFGLSRDRQTRPGLHRAAGRCNRCGRENPSILIAATSILARPAPRRRTGASLALVKLQHMHLH